MEATLLETCTEDLRRLRHRLTAPLLLIIVRAWPCRAREIQILFAMAAQPRRPSARLTTSPPQGSCCAAVGSPQTRTPAPTHGAARSGSRTAVANRTPPWSRY